MPDNIWGEIVFALAPTVLVGLVFWMVLRAIVRADRAERKAYAEIEAEERARPSLPQEHANGTTVSQPPGA